MLFDKLLWLRTLGLIADIFLSRMAEQSAKQMFQIGPRPPSNGTCTPIPVLKP